MVHYFIFFFLCCLAGVAHAHVSEQGLVLLLPTDFYIGSGVLVVVLTLLLVLLLPASVSMAIFRHWQMFLLRLNSKRSNRSFVAFVNKSSACLQLITSLLSLIFLCGLLLLGLFGTSDPLENPLPLFIWTVWWIGLPILQGVIGNIWHWVNPWAGIHTIIQRAGWRAPFTLHDKTGVWPGIILFLLFTSFALADISPDAPQRLSWIVGCYWCFTLLCVCLYGEQWFKRGECFSMLLRRFSQLSVIGIERRSLASGFPGWRLIVNKSTSVSAAIFILVLLGTGTFDGFNETFTWLALIGVNPLEFPGRSSVVSETVIGLFLTNGLLIAIYGFCVYAGLRIANRSSGEINQVSFKTAFCALAIAVLPIAFAYHFAHFLVTFLINGQYAVAAVSDPLSNGIDLLNLGSFYVTTGFMNSPASVRAIWLTQAVAVVVGHVVSVLLAHAVAIELFGNARRAIVSQVPLAVFMVLYTFIGLWLLASPKGA